MLVLVVAPGLVVVVVRRCDRRVVDVGGTVVVGRAAVVPVGAVVGVAGIGPPDRAPPGGVVVVLVFGGDRSGAGCTFAVEGRASLPAPVRPDGAPLTPGSPTGGTHEAPTRLATNSPT